MKTPQTAVAAVALCAAALAHPLLAAPVWEAGQYAPGSWRPLDGNNLLLGRSAQMTGDYYVEWGRCVDGADLGLLTDGTVPGDSPEFCIVGITAGVTLTWTFDAPVVIDALRITSRWWDAGRDGIGIDAVRVRYADSDGWD